MPTFHTLHSIETVLALVGASLLINGIEKCSDTCCSNTETSQIVHEVAETIKQDVDELKEFHNDEHKTLTPRSESESTVYNFAHNPTVSLPGSEPQSSLLSEASLQRAKAKLINKENKKINVSHEYVHLQ